MIRFECNNCTKEVCKPAKNKNFYLCKHEKPSCFVTPHTTFPLVDCVKKIVVEDSTNPAIPMMLNWDKDR
jgi:hypothetical protein